MTPKLHKHPLHASWACKQQHVDMCSLDAQGVAERGGASKTPKLQTPSAVRLTATTSGISMDDAAVVAAELAAAAADGKSAQAALARIFPKGSDARRRAVTALGEALYTHMRACHVVPAACTAMAAVAGTCTALPLPPAMLDGAPLHPVALSGPAPPGQGAPAGAAPAAAAHIALQVTPGQQVTEVADAYPASAWRPLAEVREGVAWLQGELGRRGAPFNPIHAGPGADLDVAFFAELLPGCLEGHGSGCEQLRTVAGPRARLSTQYRYNQLLPPFAVDALLAASLLAAARRAPDGAQGVSEAAVAEDATWLRALLAAELDTALGPEGLRTPGAIAGALGQLVADGTLVRAPGGPDSPLLRLAQRSDGARAVAFGASLLAPLLATYCTALPLAVAALQQAPGGTLPAKKLLRCIQVALWEGSAEPAAPESLPDPGKPRPSGATGRRGWFGRAGKATEPAAAPAEPRIGPDAARAHRPLGVSPLPSLVTVQGVLAAFKRLGVLDSVLDEAGGRTARAGGPRGPLGRRRGRPAAGRAGRSAAAAAEAAAAAAAAAEAAHVSPFGRAEGGGTPQGEDEGGLEPLAMDKSFSVAFASQLSAAGDAVCPSGGAPPGESAAERIARIVTPRASARAKAAKAREAAAAARTGGLAGPSAEVLQLGAAFVDSPEAGDALVARMQAFMWA